MNIFFIHSLIFEGLKYGFSPSCLIPALKSVSENKTARNTNRKACLWQSGPPRRKSRPPGVPTVTLFAAPLHRFTGGRVGVKPLMAMPIKAPARSPPAVHFSLPGSVFCRPLPAPPRPPPTTRPLCSARGRWVMDGCRVLGRREFFRVISDAQRGSGRRLSDGQPGWGRLVRAIDHVDTANSREAPPRIPPPCPRLVSVSHIFSPTPASPQFRRGSPQMTYTFLRAASRLAPPDPL